MFVDRSDEVFHDDDFSVLNSFTNCLITGHQAFFTHEALSSIAETTISNLEVIKAVCLSV